MTPPSFLPQLNIASHQNMDQLSLPLCQLSPCNRELMLIQLSLVDGVLKGSDPLGDSPPLR